jgi:trehalose 6-phosphate synthase
MSDVLLVNPVRDGMNLVAKEGPLLNTADGVLVLSHEAGAWEELGPAGALGVNPFDVTATAEALHAALTMPGAERARRASALRTTVQSRTAADWWDDQLEAAAQE